PRAAHAAARRAVRRARSVHAGRTVVDPAGALDRPQADGAPSDSRLARGGVSRQPHLRDERAPRPHPRRQPRHFCPPAYGRDDVRAGFRRAEPEAARVHRRCPDCFERGCIGTGSGLTMIDFDYRQKAWSAGLIVLFFVAWELFCLMTGMSDLVLPRPSQVFVTLFEKFPILWPHILQTLATTMIGFVLGVGLGVVLGAVIGVSKTAYDTA